jgi:hypothetical protein
MCISEYDVYKWIWCVSVNMMCISEYDVYKWIWCVSVNMMCINGYDLWWCLVESFSDLLVVWVFRLRGSCQLSDSCFGFWSCVWSWADTDHPEGLAASIFRVMELLGGLWLTSHLKSYLRYDRHKAQVLNLVLCIYWHKQSALLGCDMWIVPVLMEFMSSLRALTWGENSGWMVVWGLDTDWICCAGCRPLWPGCVG